MSTRKAKFTDIPRIAELIVEAHGKSIYANRCEVDVKEAKGLLMNAMQRDGSPMSGGTKVLVAETDGQIEGMLVGVLDRIYGCFDRLYATDIVFYRSTKAAIGDAVAMLQDMFAWARANPRVIEIRLGAPDVLGDEWKRVGRLYERLGLKPAGGMWAVEIER